MCLIKSKHNNQMYGLYLTGNNPISNRRNPNAVGHNCPPAPKGTQKK